MQDLNQLTFIQLDGFNPEYSDEACFTIHNRQFEVAANMSVDASGNRTYSMPVELNTMQRVCVLQAIDILIDEYFNDESSFEDDENPERIYFTEHRLYSDKGRSLN